MNKELAANTNLSHYRIVSKIGAGGMGEVYLVEDLRLCRQVALKVLTPRADRETGTLAAAVETSVVTDGHTTSSSDYIVKKIKRHKLGAATALVILIGLVTLGSLAYSRYFAGRDQTGIDSLAVLPFANDTGNPEMEYLSDGLSESLINNLSQLPRLKIQ